MPPPRRTRASRAKARLPISPWLAAVLAVIGVTGLTFTVTVVVDDTGKPATNLTVTVNEQQDRPPGTGDETQIEVPKTAVAKARSAGDFGDNLHDESPPGTPAQEISNAEQQQERIQAASPEPLVFPLAATPRIGGCRSRFVRNQSSRNGVRPLAFAVHYTAGNGPVNAFIALFDRASFQASSHFIHTRDGSACAYIVPVYRKAWTIAALNPVTVNTEVIQTGYQRPFMTKRGYRKLGYTIARVNHIYPSIKLQLGKVRSCKVTRPGVITHYQGGLCAGGHVDICAQPCHAPAGAPFSLLPIVKQAKIARCELYRKSARSRRSCLRAIRR